MVVIGYWLFVVCWMLVWGWAAGDLPSCTQEGKQGRSSSHLPLHGEPENLPPTPSRVQEGESKLELEYRGWSHRVLWNMRVSFSTEVRAANNPSHPERACNQQTTN